MKVYHPIMIILLIIGFNQTVQASVKTTTIKLVVIQKELYCNSDICVIETPDNVEYLNTTEQPQDVQFIPADEVTYCMFLAKGVLKENYKHTDCEGDL